MSFVTGADVSYVGGFTLSWEGGSGYGGTITGGGFSGVGAGDLMVMMCRIGIPLDSVCEYGVGFPGVPTDTLGSVWHAGPVVIIPTEECPDKWQMALYWAIAPAAGVNAYSLDFSLFNGADVSLLVDVGGAGSVYSCTGGSFTLDASNGAVGGTDSPTLELDASSLATAFFASALIIPNIPPDVSFAVPDGWSTGPAGGVTDGGIIKDGFEDAYLALTYTGPPAPPSIPPIWYNRVPLTLDFASMTYDQANRLAMYELYRACGLDPANPFLQSIIEGLSDEMWTPPSTITITVFADAVDADWNILKKIIASGDAQPLCGKRITIDPSVDEEWAGDYEVMKATYNPLQPASFSSGGINPSMPSGTATIAPSADASGGTITLVLRTYNEEVLSFDTSQTPSYANVPGPIFDDEVG
jgi:hypothetical protein